VDLPGRTSRVLDLWCHFNTPFDNLRDAEDSQHRDHSKPYSRVCELESYVWVGWSVNIESLLSPDHVAYLDKYFV